MRKVEIPESEIENVARKIAQAFNIDPDLMVVPGTLPQVWLPGGLYTAFFDHRPHPAWHAFKNAATVAMSMTAKLAGVEFIVIAAPSGDRAAA